MATVAFQVLGCRLNRAEAETMAQGFIRAGHRIVHDPLQADIRVVHTCTVTAEAARKSRKAARRGGEDQTLVVTGCHCELHPREFSEAQVLVPARDKLHLVDKTLDHLGLQPPPVDVEDGRPEVMAGYPLALGSTRAFVMIQDGCNQRCSFCLTTLARGASRCRPASDILDEVRLLARQGCREVVLTGVHAGSYAEGATDLGALVDRLLTETPLPRLRLSSMEPWTFREAWLNLWKRFEGRLCRHLHMSLQSGSNTVLQRMRRNCSVEAFEQKLAAIRRAVPGMAVTTDLIAGFPGETDAEHLETLGTLQRIRPSGAHVFPFSPRPWTEAATLPDPVDTPTKRARVRQIRALTDASAQAFREAQVGTTCAVLWERVEEQGFAEGYSDTYLKVQVPCGVLQANTVSKVCIAGADGDRLLGEPVI